MPFTGPRVKGESRIRSWKLYWRTMPRSWSHSDVSRSIPQEVSTCLFRVLQESLTNVVKHSEVKAAQEELTGRPSKIQLQIGDSGVGFDPESTRSRGGLGLISMRERLSLLGGEVLIESRTSGNTWIKACVPLTQ